MVPNSICWNITSRCNDDCAFCYRELDCKELPFEEQKTVIDQVARSGVRKLTFAGGEPLLVPKIHELITYGKQKGLMVSLTTNAVLLENRVEECRFLFQTLDWLTLSLDGPDERVQAEMGRAPKQVERVKTVLGYAMKGSERKCRIKINTVVSRVNQKAMIAMADLIKTYPVDRWKLFQFTPVRGNAVRAQKRYQITDQEFRQVAADVQNQIGNKLILSLSDRVNIESAYFVIFPNGDIRISDQQDDRVVGNVLTDDIGEIWEGNAFKKGLHESRTLPVFA